MTKDNLQDPDKILLRISKGESLSGDEVSSIVDLLNDWGNGTALRERSQDDLYGYLVVLNKAGLKQHYKILERFLDSKDALTVSFVLQTLCVDWAMADEYLQRAVSFAIGAPWDHDGDARELALKILGEYLRSDLEPDTIKTKNTFSKSQKEVLSLLFSTVSNSKNSNWVRQAAYFAICRTYGMTWEELPPECSLIMFDKDDSSVDEKMLGFVESLLA